MFALVAASACSEGAKPAASGGASVRREVSSSGGQVALPGGQTVDVPAGALDSSTTITVAEADPAALQPEPDQIDLVAKPVVFTPHGLTFKVPVTLTIPYVSASKDLVVLRLDDERDTTWEVVPATFEGGKARIQTTRFSVYGVAQRLDSSATCTEICARLGACEADCASRCATTRSTCLPSAWGQVVACLASSSSPDAGACGPVTQFTDAFARPDAPSLGGCWITYPALTASPELKGQRACGDVQSAALMPVNSARTTIAYDWSATDPSGLETNALVVQDSGSGSPVGFFAGLDGGFTPPRLVIKAFDRTVIGSPVDLALAPNTTYRLTATFDPSGAISAAITSGTTTLGSVNGNVGRAIAFNRAGFIVGRNNDAKLTCIDDFTLTNAASGSCAGVASCLASGVCTAPSSVVDGGVSDASTPRDASPSDASSAGDSSADAATRDGAADASSPSSDAGTDGGACAPIARGEDNFARTDAASLGGCWLTYPALAPSPRVVGRRACGDTQSAAVLAVTSTPRMTIAYDWSASDASGLETYAIVLQDSGNGTPTGYIAGVDGGSTPPRLVIKSLQGTVIAGPLDVALAPNTTYLFNAEFHANGDIIVGIFSGPTTYGRLSGNVGGPLAFNRLGFIVGRNNDSNLTCLNFVAIDSSPVP